MSFREKPQVRAAVYGVTLFVLAFCVAMLGPSLLQFSLQTGSSVKETGYVLGVRSFAYLCGGFLSWTFDKYPGHWILGVSAILGGVISALFPHCKSLFALGAVAVGQGVILCQLDVGANILLLFLGMAPQTQNSWLQFLHFMFALGATISPLALQVSASAAGAPSEPKLNADGTEEVVYTPGAYNAAYLFAAALCVAVGVGVLLLPSPKPRGKEGDSNKAQDNAASGSDPAAIGKLEDIDITSSAAAPSSSSSSSSSSSDKIALTEKEEEGSKPKEAEEDAQTRALRAQIEAEPPMTQQQLRKHTWIVVAEVAGILGAYVGAEAGVGFLLTAISVIGWGLTEAQGQSLTAAYWGAITVGRLAAVPLSRMMKPERMLAIDIVGSIAGLVLLVFFQGSVAGIWFSVIVYGVFMASTYPTAVALLDHYAQVEGSHGSAIVLGGASGEWLIPFLISSFIGADTEGEAIAISPEDAERAKVVFLALNLVACVACLGFFLLLRMHGPKLKLRREKFAREKKLQQQTEAGGAKTSSVVASDPVLLATGGTWHISGVINSGGFGAAGAWETFDAAKHHYNVDGSARALPSPALVALPPMQQRPQLTTGSSTEGEWGTAVPDASPHRLETGAHHDFFSASSPLAAATASSSGGDWQVQHQHQQQRQHGGYGHVASSPVIAVSGDDEWR